MGMVADSSMIVRKLVPAGNSDVSKDEIYDILSNQRRRIALRYLIEQEGGCSVAEIVDIVATREAAKLDVDRTDNLDASVYSALVQSHLPRMADYGFVEYDPEGRHVTLTDEARAIEPYLERPDRLAVRWSLLYMALAVFGAVLLGVTWFDVGPAASFDPLGVAGFVVLSFLLLATIHTYVLVSRMD